MIIIENTLISDDIVYTKFCCNLQQCKGICCVEGDAGAPLDASEIDILESIVEDIIPYMIPAAVDVLRKKGVFEVGDFNEYLTPLLNGKACIYAIYDAGIAYCAIEKAFRDGRINFQKPISCHLYPVRISQLHGYEAINYHQWGICKSACTNGNQLSIPVYKFLKEPLIRKYGNDWYNLLLEAIEKLK